MSRENLEVGAIVGYTTVLPDGEFSVTAVEITQNRGTGYVLYSDGGAGSGTNIDRLQYALPEFDVVLKEEIQRRKEEVDQVIRSGLKRE